MRRISRKPSPAAAGALREAMLKRRHAEERRRSVRREEPLLLKFFEGMRAGAKARRLLEELRELRGSKRVFLTEEELRELKAAVREGKKLSPAVKARLERKLHALERKAA